MEEESVTKMDCSSEEFPFTKLDPSAAEDEDGAPILPSNGVDKSNQSVNMVKIGKFSDISNLMSCLASRDDRFLDLDLICSEGKILSCHKFILGAQSTYLRQLMLSIDKFGGTSEEDNRCKMHFPDIEIEHMEVILRFLYTG